MSNGLSLLFHVASANETISRLGNKLPLIDFNNFARADATYTYIIGPVDLLFRGAG